MDFNSFFIFKIKVSKFFHVHEKPYVSNVICRLAEEKILYMAKNKYSI